MSLTVENGFWMPSQLIAIKTMADADGDFAAAKLVRNASDIAVAEQRLRNAVLASRAVGISWQSIRDCLGMRRGAAAYQRFRQKRIDSINASDRASKTPAL